MPKKKNKVPANYKPQSILLDKVIVLEAESPLIVGSGYMIRKSNGESRLDAMDLDGNHLNAGWYQYHVEKTVVAYTTDSIN